jgi:hypothetical protein
MTDATTPQRLYRYFSFGPYIENVISGESLRFQNPLSFNDPFDCRPSVYANLADPAVEQYYHDLGKRFGMGRAQRRRQIRELKSHLEKTGGKGAVSQEHLMSNMAKYGLLCLTPHPDSLLMWSHYGDRHHGLCIAFDTAVDFFRTAIPIAYQDEYPEIKIGVSSNDDILNKSIYTKASCWKYEDEWRVPKQTWSEEDRKEHQATAEREWPSPDDVRNIVDHRGPGEYKFNKAAVKGTILGARMPEENRTQIAEWIRQHNPEVKLFQAKCHDHEYRLVIEPLA